MPKRVSVSVGQGTTKTKLATQLRFTVLASEQKCHEWKYSNLVEGGTNRVGVVTEKVGMS